MTLHPTGSPSQAKATVLLALAPFVLAFSAAPGWSQTGGPTVVEPGFQVTHFVSCGYGYNHGVPSPLGPGTIHGAACTPGGSWGDYLLLSVQTWWDDDGSYVEAVDFSGHSRRYLDTAGHVFPTYLAFSPPGWRGGDLLFVNTYIFASWSPLTNILMYTPSRTYAGTAGSTGSDGRLAVDPSGDFGHDVFREVWDWPATTYLGVFRRDAAGNETLFSASGSVGRFGPGGAWGTGLYDSGRILHPDATITTFPVNFGRYFDWATGPGFAGDMFAWCGSPGQICRITPAGTSTLFATGARGAHLTSCGGSLWIAGYYGCDVITPILLTGTADLSPSTLNVKGQGNDVSVRLTISDATTGQALDSSLLSPVWVSKVSSPWIGTVTLPAPSAAPGCDDWSMDGIWETPGRRVIDQDGILTVRFATPSDGSCATMDGDRQEILALLLDVPDGEAASICVTGRYPGYLASVEACGTVTVQNRGNR